MLKLLQFEWSNYFGLNTRVTVGKGECISFSKKIIDTRQVLLKNKLTLSSQREFHELLGSDQAENKVFVSISPSLLPIYKSSWAKFKSRSQIYNESFLSFSLVTPHPDTSVLLSIGNQEDPLLQESVLFLYLPSLPPDNAHLVRV